MHYETLKDFAGPIATIIAAFTAAGITWRFGRVQADIAAQQANTGAFQAHLASVRLQHDLYNRRYAVYASVKAFLVQVTQNARAESDWIAKYGIEVGDAVFLLNQELVDYLEEIRKKGIRLRFILSVVNLPEYVEARTKLIDEEAEIMNWFPSQFEILRDKFKPFLSLGGGDLVADEMVTKSFLQSELETLSMRLTIRMGTIAAVSVAALAAIIKL
jgi:hypothetical protein